jgi:hypothetical protein
MSWRSSVTRPYVLIDRESWRPFFNPVLFCGVALVLTIPSARTVHDLAGASLLSGVPVFFTTYALFQGLLGLGIGTTSAARGERGARMFLSLTLRVLFGQLLCLPYLLFSRALFPGHTGAFALIVLLTSLVSLFFALLSRLLEESPRWAPSAGFLAKYGVFICYHVAPLAWLPLLSPLGAVRLLLDGATVPEQILALAVPAALVALTSWFGVRRMRSPRV